MILLLALSACAPTAETFPDQLAVTWCARLEECYKADYDSLYDDRAECEDDVADDVDDVFGECDFDQDDAIDCLGELREDDCDDIADAFSDCLYTSSAAYECELGDYF